MVPLKQEFVLWPWPEVPGAKATGQDMCFRLQTRVCAAELLRANIGTLPRPLCPGGSIELV